MSASNEPCQVVVGPLAAVASAPLRPTATATSWYIVPRRESQSSAGHAHVQPSSLPSQSELKSRFAIRGGSSGEARDKHPTHVAGVRIRTWSIHSAHGRSWSPRRWPRTHRPAHGRSPGSSANRCAGNILSNRSFSALDVCTHRRRAFHPRAGPSFAGRLYTRRVKPAVKYDARNASELRCSPLTSRAGSFSRLNFSVRSRSAW